MAGGGIGLCELNPKVISRLIRAWSAADMVLTQSARGFEAT